MIALGLDIVKGSPLSRTLSPMYSAVIVNDSNEIVEELHEATLNTIIRLAWEYSVDRIGVDNIYELAPTPRDVARILSLLPGHTEVYQVTLENNIFVDLSVQASKIGLTLSSKPKPLQTAYICALLAIKGIGTPVKGLERKTKIIVTRSRSVGSGGSSSNRYARGIRTAILRIVKEIKTLLENEKLDYDVVIRKSLGGLDGAIFTVYASSDKVRGIIRSYQGKDVRIIVKPVYSDIITVHQENNKKRPLIIGLDPGIETGLALLDLSLNVLLVTSSRSLDRLDIVNKIYYYGIPVLVAVDKNPPPENAKKLAAMIGVQLYFPSESLTIEMKNKLIEWLKRKKRIDIKINTTHERDALAAALRAYKAYERKLQELERRVLEMSLDADVDELKVLVLKGYEISKVIEYAIDRHLSNTYDALPVPSGNPVKHSSIACDEKVRTLELKLANLVKENEMLKGRLREIENKLKDLSFEKRFTEAYELSTEAQQDRVLARLSEQLRQLQDLIDHLRKRVDVLTNEKKEYLKLLLLILARRVAVIPRLKTVPQNFDVLKEILSPNKILVIDSSIIPCELVDLAKRAKLLLIFEKCSEELEQRFIASGIPIVCNITVERLDEDLAAVYLDELEEAVIETMSKIHLSKRKPTSIDLSDVIRIISEYRNNISAKSTKSCDK